MAQLTWRNVDTPDLRGAMDGVGKAAELISHSFDKASGVIGQFQGMRADNADREIMLRRMAITDPEAYKRALAEGTLIGPNGQHASSAALLGTENRYGTLLDHAAKSEDYKQTVHDNTRSRETDRLGDALAPLNAERTRLMAAGDWKGADAILNSPEYKAARIAQQNGVTTAGTAAYTAGQGYRNDDENRFVANSAADLSAQVKTTDAYHRLLNERLNPSDPKKAGLDPRIARRIDADMVAQGYGSYFAPLGSGTAAAGAGGAASPAGTAPATTGAASMIAGAAGAAGPVKVTAARLPGSNVAQAVTYDTGTEKEIRTDGTRAWRNNSRGNIFIGTEPGAFKGSFAERTGAVGLDADGYAIYATKEAGDAAHEKLIRNNYMKMSIADMAAKYAPEGHGKNDPVKYSKDIARDVGVPVGTRLDTLTPEQFSKFLASQGKHEGWGEGNVTRQRNATAADAVNTTENIKERQGNQYSANTLATAFPDILTAVDLDVPQAIQKAIKDGMFPATEAANLDSLVRDVQKQASEKGYSMPAYTALAILSQSAQRKEFWPNVGSRLSDFFFNDGWAHLDNGLTVNRDAVANWVNQVSNGDVAKAAEVNRDIANARALQEKAAAEFNAAQELVKQYREAAKTNKRLIENGSVKAAEDAAVLAQARLNAAEKAAQDPALQPDRNKTDTTTPAQPSNKSSSIIANVMNQYGNPLFPGGSSENARVPDTKTPVNAPVYTGVRKSVAEREADNQADRKRVTEKLARLQKIRDEEDAERQRNREDIAAQLKAERRKAIEEAKRNAVYVNSLSR